MERMQGTAASKGAGPQARGTASPSQTVAGGALYLTSKDI